MLLLTLSYRFQSKSRNFWNFESPFRWICYSYTLYSSIKIIQLFHVLLRVYAILVIPSSIKILKILKFRTSFHVCLLSLFHAESDQNHKTLCVLSKESVTLLSYRVLILALSRKPFAHHASACIFLPSIIPPQWGSSSWVPNLRNIFFFTLFMNSDFYDLSFGVLTECNLITQNVFLYLPKLDVFARPCSPHRSQKLGPSMELNEYRFNF